MTYVSAILETFHHTFDIWLRHLILCKVHWVVLWWKSSITVLLFSITFYCVIFYIIQLFNICDYNKVGIINVTVHKFFLIGNKKAGVSHKSFKIQIRHCAHICLQNNVSGFNEVENPVQIFSGFHYLNSNLSFWACFFDHLS